MPWFARRMDIWCSKISSPDQAAQNQELRYFDKQLICRVYLTFSKPHTGLTNIKSPQNGPVMALSRLLYRPIPTPV